MYYTVIDIIAVLDRISLVYVASDAVNLKEDPREADGVWCVDRSTADKMAVGDYIKKPDNIRWECKP